MTRAGRVACLLGVLGFGYRVVLVLAGAPPSNSDEATIGLAGLHIAGLRDFPAYFYDSNYMGAIEAYLAAPLLAVGPLSRQGAAVVLLRTPTLLMYGAFLVLVYQLTRRLYTPWLATFTVGLLALGADRVVKDQLIAGGGYPEINVAGAALFLLAVWIPGRPDLWTRLWCGVFGVVAGIALWSDPLVAPYVLAAALVLGAGLLRARSRPGTASPDAPPGSSAGDSGPAPEDGSGPGRAGVRRPATAAVGGLVVGLLPAIVFNLSTPANHNTFAALAAVRTAQGQSSPLPDRLHGAVVLGISLATGTCSPSHCAPGQVWWGIAYLPLLVLAGLLAFRGRDWGRLGLLLAGLASVLAYLDSPASGLYPIESSRYLSVLQIVTPAVLWPVWQVASRRGLWRWAGTAVLGGLAVTMAIATVTMVGEVGTYRTDERTAQQLASTVRDAGIRDAYSDYWTCDRLMFLADEKVVCAVLDDHLHTGLDRYQPDRAEVQAAGHPAYLFVAGGPGDVAFGNYLRLHHVSATVTTAGRYHIYRPAVPLHLR